MIDGRMREQIRAVLMPFAADIDAVAVFGSHATGRARINSDIDLVLYGHVDQALTDRIWSLFEESSLPVTVDVLAYSDALYPPLKDHIDRWSIRLFNHTDLCAETAWAA